MKRNTFNLLMVLGLVLALGGGIVMARRAQAQGPGPEGPLGTQAAVSTAFTYQGRVVFDGTPVVGTCDFEFSLWDAPSDGNQVAAQGAADVVVNDGYFSVDLNFGSEFTGDARYLQIGLDCGPGSAVLDQRVALTAAPYAHSLRPGAVIEGTSTGNILSVQNTSTSGYGVYGKSGTASGKPALFGVGVWGDGDSSVGVYGTSNSSGGVVGFSTSNSGVAGISTSGNGVDGASSSGVGVYGTAPTTGTVGIATSTGIGYGVYGRNASSSGAGVYGESSYSSGTGVRGYSAAGPGVEGSSTSSNGVVGSSTSGNGVWGYSTSGHAIYSEGDTHINGDLTWSARTGYVAVAAAAFHPMGGGYAFSNDGYKLQNTDGSSDYYVAPVQLPHGAIVTSLTFYWNDGSWDYDGSCGLYRIDLAGNEVNMATTATSGAAGTSDSSQDITIAYAAVDNSQYAYYVYWGLPDNAVLGYGAVIEYTFTEPY